CLAARSTSVVYSLSLHAALPILVHGPQAAQALESLMPVDILDLPAGQQRYALLTDENGGILDDLMVANLGDERLLLVVNAACKRDRKSTRLNSSHVKISYAVFCL